MQIKYSPDVDTLIIRLKKGKVVDSEDVADCLIVHYGKNREPLEIEILGASKKAYLDDIDISWKDLIARQLVPA